MANRSLSQPTINKHHQRKIDKHRFAVMMLARSQAVKVIKARLKEQGVRLTLVKPRDINDLAYPYLAEHREQLLAEAERIIATSPRFKSWRLPVANILSDAQTKTQPISTTSAVQKLGAK